MKADEIPERRAKVLHLHTTSSENYLVEVMSRFSSFLKLQRTFAYMYRFINRLRPTGVDSLNSSFRLGPLTRDELQVASRALIRIVQVHYMGNELLQLQQGTSSRTLTKLSPYLDETGLLRVGGRLSHAQIPSTSKHPYILPKKAWLSTLLCDHYHLSYLHAGAHFVQSLLLRNYWIIGIRSLIRTRLHRCLICHKFQGKSSQPIMADLPSSRVNQSRPFSHVGIDFAGPFTIKTSSRKNAPKLKGYLCVFVCFATKAVHLEVVSSLGTPAFIATLDRFIARRGLPVTIRTDCGKNFVGASRHLKDVNTFLQNNLEYLYTYFSVKSIEWQFNPPSAPNFGGLGKLRLKVQKPY